MRRTKRTPAVLALAVPLLAVGCAAPPTDDGVVASTSEALNGTLVNKGPLTRKSLSNTSSEADRRKDTDGYYNNIGVSADGSKRDGTIASTLGTLKAFIGFYFTNGGTTRTAVYYNRADLGIGREMNCNDSLVNSGQIACYVRNYAAGDDGSEFTFGGSSNVAFDNLNAGHAFATVAMVFRSAPKTNKVFFVVYDSGGNLVTFPPSGNLSNFAALDRFGISFANAFAQNGNQNPDPTVFGTPGVNLNDHIPSNCLNCHGGFYTSNAQTKTYTVSSTFFLPFDLDQFEYQDTPGRTRNDQLDAFRTLNEMVRKVAALMGPDPAANNIAVGVNIVQQLDGWYHNTAKQTDRTEVFEHQFDSDFVPTAWNVNANTVDVYRKVVRGMCRNCHIAQIGQGNFSLPGHLVGFGAVVPDICSFQMPHALQTVRQFWLSDAPQSLESYFRSVNATTQANALHNCGPGGVVTLDPPQIEASSTAL
jgi:hypothetical protein